MHDDHRTNRTLTPREAHTWYSIERALRSELPVAKIERRAQLRADRSLIAAALAVLVGVVVSAAAAVVPVALLFLGVLSIGLGLGMITCRGLLAVVSIRHRR